MPDKSADQEENDPAQPVAWTAELTATSEDDAGDDNTGGDSVILCNVPESIQTHCSNNCAFHQPTQERNHLAITTNTTNQSQLQTKLATSVSKVLGVTPLVKTLDKAKKALHHKRNLNNSYYQVQRYFGFCSNTSASSLQEFHKRNISLGEGICD